MQLHSSLEYRHGETVIVLYARHVWRPLSHCLRVKSDDWAHYNNMYLADDHNSSPRLFVYPENTGCNRRNGPDFGRVFLMLNYTEKPQNTYIQS